MPTIAPHRRPPTPAEDPDPAVRERERALMGRVSGLLMTVAVPVMAVAAILPGASVRMPAFAVLCVLFLAHGASAATGLMPWGRISIQVHALAVGTSFAALGVGVWATGGASSFLVPYLACTLLYVAYFFPVRHAWPLGIGVIAVAFSPVLYERAPAADGFLPRALVTAVSFAALAVAVRYLKGRLLAAEREQRRMAVEDPLTGVANRRAYDAAMASATDGSVGESSVVLLDLDGFKVVNDRHGHPAGDALLREVAQACRTTAGEGHLVARIGGDEFAIVAPGAGAQAADALAVVARDAVRACRTPDGDPVAVAAARATWPSDGADAAALVAIADARLYAAKRRAASTTPVRDDAWMPPSAEPVGHPRRDG